MVCDYDGFETEYLMIKNMIKRKLILFVFCTLSLLTLPLQEAQADTITAAPKTWKFDGVFGVNMAGTGLLYWTSGGKNTSSALSFAKLHLLYYKDALAWETNFDTDFGLSWTQQDEDPWKKTSDNIKLVSKFGLEFKPDWYFTVLCEFQSQYAVGRKMKTGYDLPISKWLAPSYTDLSVGVDWKKNFNGCDFSLYMSPLVLMVTTAYVSDAVNDAYNAEHQELVPDDPDWDFRRSLQSKYGTFKVVKDDFGIPDIEWRNVRLEPGMAIRGTLSYRKDNMTLLSTITLSTPYQGRGYDVKEAYENTHPGETWDYPFRYSNMNRQFGNFDVDWDISLTYQFAKVLDVTLSTNLRYYNGVLIADSNGIEKERLQLKTIVGIGFGYSF